MVLVLPRKVLESVGEFQSYSLEIDKSLDVVLHPQNNFLISGDVAGKSPEYKQIISYVVLRFEGQVFTYFRGLSSHEARLIGRRSVGLGGHIEETDVASLTADRRSYQLAVQREIGEGSAVPIVPAVSARADNRFAPFQSFRSFRTRRSPWFTRCSSRRLYRHFGRFTM